jgi:hypothetical protein
VNGPDSGPITPTFIVSAREAGSAIAIARSGAIARLKIHFILSPLSKSIRPSGL